MSISIDRPSGALAAIALFGALLVAAPTLAQTSASPATTTKASTKTTAAKPAADPVETRITELHTKLKITSDQEANWGTFAQVMRDNAKAMDGMLQQRAQNLRSMTAIDDLKSYRDFTQAHADGLQKLIPAFQTVYDSMTPDQKKNADTVFAQSYGPHRGVRAKVAKGS